jgi:hypothetical protein
VRIEYYKQKEQNQKRRTKISPVITHTTGPQEIAKKAIYDLSKV